ncbi:MAG: hypothetical protein WCQ26_13665 [Pseudanabaena sp. ELA748]
MTLLSPTLIPNGRITGLVGAGGIGFSFAAVGTGFLFETGTGFLFETGTGFLVAAVGGFLVEAVAGFLVAAGFLVEGAAAWGFTILELSVEFIFFKF